VRGGRLVRADVTDPAVVKYIRNLCGAAPVPLIVADPPYGNIVNDKWDQVESIVGKKNSLEELEDAFVQWMIDWTLQWADVLADGGAFYIWGGIGTPGFRPFYGFLNRIERASKGTLTLANHITWKKKRAYGVQNNYIFTREELAYFIKGDPKKPRCFNVPYTDKKRDGSWGKGAKYQAHSEYLRRSNVWDETEILRGKRHVCQKPSRVNRIPIETHTIPGEIVIDLFSGSGGLSKEAQALARPWIALERDAATCDAIRDWLSEGGEQLLLATA
jgi:DNA modification methylase